MNNKVENEYDLSVEAVKNTFEALKRHVKDGAEKISITSIQRKMNTNFNNSEIILSNLVYVGAALQVSEGEYELARIH